ncbi:hypothetical protein PQR70_28290 [Paraburkholderia madseniana]|uniref:Uncharacterized protein n=1 Tax=Paraburkholderia madseniana TaxID=2599607 RepID=A0ABT3UIZ3_9BURK|nr:MULTISPECIES: hypothetical protein [Paraburkholderia]MCX4147903.1 hypothetical protein [Paraburkholderia madseniana]
MSQLNELSADTTMANDMRAANVTRHDDQSTSPNSPTPQEVRL